MNKSKGRNRLRGSLKKDERGLTVVEYALLLVVVLMAAVVGYQKLGKATDKKTKDIANELAWCPAISSHTPRT